MSAEILENGAVIEYIGVGKSKKLTLDLGTAETRRYPSQHRPLLVTGTPEGADIIFQDIKPEAYENIKKPLGHPHNEFDGPMPLVSGQLLVFKSEVEEGK